MKSKRKNLKKQKAVFGVFLKSIAVWLVFTFWCFASAKATEIEIKAEPAATTTVTSAATMEKAVPAAPEYAGPKEVQAQNRFIQIVVNTMPFDTGRFLVRTVEGDPTRDSDNNKILIYGGAQPWTSFTTIRVDGKDYVFGGPTQRRAGKQAQYGEMIEPPHAVGDSSVVTRCRIAGLDVTETLGIVGGPVSKIYDTIRISYSIKNTTGEPHKVGVRVLIDTLLGSNDASPFKVGDQSITTETELTGSNILDYWIAYDSLENPGVVARGTLRGQGLTTPDRVIFANWGKLADNPWAVSSNSGQSFQREGEDGMDSATALYWDEATIQPQGDA
ncbi:MAG TPA: hypothetical protein PLQ76_01380, partial [bacterium]|nr:hypothetical protein [bacterium]